MAYRADTVQAIDVTFWGPQYTSAVPESNPFHEEIRTLAEQVAAIEDEDVADAAATIARQYRERHTLLVGLLNIDVMAASDAADVA